MALNQQFEQIYQSPTVALTDRIKALQNSGQRIIPLQVGDPNFATPPAVIEVAINAMQDGFTHYSPSRGLPDLRTAIASKLYRDNQLTYSPEFEILVTHGGVHAYYLAVLSIINPGDEVLIPDPSWATHANIVLMLRGKAVRVPALPESEFIPSIDAWKRALTPKTRALVINYPSNPTGTYPTREYLQQLHDFASEQNLWVISDEVYGNLYFQEQPTSAGELNGSKEHTILINSLSKTYAMTGWRVGFLAAPKQVIENALKAGQNSITCLAPFVQKAAAFALKDEEVQLAAARMRAAFSRRREIVMRVVGEYAIPFIRVTPPKGAFYFFHDLRSLAMPSEEICERILEETGVGLVPGSTFGAVGEGFVRMSIAASDQDVETGMRMILNWVDKQVGKK